MRKWLIILRGKEGLTQEAVAEKAGITRQMVGALEGGKAKPSVDTAKAIAAALHFEKYKLDWTKFFEVKED